MNYNSIKNKIEGFLSIWAQNKIERHQIIVYILHSVLVVTVIFMQFLGLGGSHEFLPLAMSAIHLVACLFSLSLFLTLRLTLPQAFSLTTLVAQCSIAVRFSYFSTVQPDNFLQLIIINQIASLLAVFFLVLSFVRFTPFIVSTISMISYACVATYLNEPALWQMFVFFFFVQFFLCALGELLRRNVMSVSQENTKLHHREASLLRAVKLQPNEIESYLRMTSNSKPTEKDVDKLFAMLKPASQRNLVNAVRIHIKSHISDDYEIHQRFPQLTKSEIDICRLIIEGKKRREISQLLSKSVKNIDVTRTHIRKKLAVPADEELQPFLVYLFSSNTITPKK